MSILHDLKEYGFIGDVGDLIEWFREDRNSDDFLINDHRHLDNDSGNHILIILEEANKELRKPLHLIDFVKEEEPKEPDYARVVETLSYYIEGEDGDLSMEEMIDLQFKTGMSEWTKAHHAWENSTPLFDGWELVNREIQYCYLRKGSSWCDFYPNIDNVKLYINGILHENPTREEFIRLCKSHNIDLLSKEVEV